MFVYSVVGEGWPYPKVVLICLFYRRDRAHPHRRELTKRGEDKWGTRSCWGRGGTSDLLWKTDKALKGWVPAHHDIATFAFALGKLFFKHTDDLFANFHNRCFGRITEQDFLELWIGIRCNAESNGQV